MVGRDLSVLGWLATTLYRMLTWADNTVRGACLAVDIGPVQRSSLASAQTGGRDDQPNGPGAVTLCTLEEDRDLFVCPQGTLFPGRVRRVGERGDVAGQQTPPH
jgi:hypothetical protein